MGDRDWTNWTTICSFGKTPFCPFINDLLGQEKKEEGQPTSWVAHHGSWKGPISYYQAWIQCLREGNSMHSTKVPPRFPVWEGFLSLFFVIFLASFSAKNWLPELLTAIRKHHCLLSKGASQMELKAQWKVCLCPGPPLGAVDGGLKKGTPPFAFMGDHIS